MNKSIKVIAIDDKRTKVMRYFIRIIENRKIKKKSLRIKLSYKKHKQYFNPKTERFRKNINFKKGEIYNDIIEKELVKIDSYITNNISVDKNATTNQLTFLKYFKIKINQELNPGTKIKKQVVFNKLLKFIKSKNKEDIFFDEITHTLVSDLFINFKTVKNPKKLSHNTAVHYLMIIKSVLNTAQKEGIYQFKRNPFSTIKLKKQKKKSVYLTIEEVEKITDANIDDISLNEVRNFFLFQVFSNGMRVSDLLKLKFKNIINGRLNYIMQKNNRQIDMPLNTYLCYLISKLYEELDNYEEIKKDSTVRVNYEGIDNKVEGESKYLNLTELDFAIKSKMGLNLTKNPNGQKILKDIFEEILEDKDKMIEIHGYKVDENDKKLIYLINQKQKLLARINQDFQDFFFQNISKFKKNKSEKFIFDFINKDFFYKDGTTDLQRYKHVKHLTIVINRKLKKLQKKLNIETSLSTHVARHTFSNLLLDTGEASVFEISKMLGHSSLLITEIYLKENFANNRLDNINEGLQNRYGLNSLT